MHLTATHNNEFTCFGLCTLPITDANYTTSTSMWLVRAYNGQRYDRGRTGEPNMAPIRAGSVVHVKVNLGERTMHLRVNDGPYQLAFSNITGAEVCAAAVCGCYTLLHHCGTESPATPRCHRGGVHVCLSQIYPIVCFYGASQVINIRSATSGVSAPSAGTVPPVSVCGRFGRVSYLAATAPLPEMVPRVPTASSGAPSIASPTATHAPAPAATTAPAGPWNCAVCTYRNSSDATACTMCSSARTVAVESQWTCEACTFLNSASDSTCTICGSNRPSGSAASASIAATAASAGMSEEEMLRQALSLSIGEAAGVTPSGGPPSAAPPSVGGGQGGC
jgi:hypothetical protein